MSKLSLSRAWDEARMVLARDGRLFASVALGIVVLPQTVIGLLAPESPQQQRGLALGLMLATMLIGFVAQVALNRLAIGPSTTVGAAIMRGVARMPVLIGAFFLLMIALFLVMIPLVILMGAGGMISTTGAGSASLGAVALILLVTALSYAVFQLAVPVAAAEDGGPLRLLMRSWHLSRGNYFRLLAFVAIMFVGLIIVLLAGQLALGSMVTVALGPPNQLSLSALMISLIAALIQAVFTVVFAVMLARIYVQLSGHDAQTSVPKTGI
jgi:hypothetical protein